MMVHLKINPLTIVQSIAYLPERVANTNIGLFVPCIITWNGKSIKRINEVNQIFIKLFEDVNISFLSLNANYRKEYTVACIYH